MNYNEIFGNIYADLITKEGTFNMQEVMVTTYLNSPGDFSKSEIKILSLKVLDEALNSGMVRMVGDGKYVSILSQDHSHFAQDDVMGM